MTGLVRRQRNNGIINTLERLTDSIFDDGFFVRPSSTLDRGPQTNVTTNDDNYQIDVVVPGVNKKDLVVDINNNTLTVAFDQTESTLNTLATSSFKKVWTLPENSDIETVNATADNGILTITIPKATATTHPQRNITIR